jgi:hypothetical protein
MLGGLEDERPRTERGNGEAERGLLSVAGCDQAEQRERDPSGRRSQKHLASPDRCLQSVQY